MADGDDAYFATIGWVTIDPARSYRFSLRTRASIWSSGPSVEFFWVTADAVGDYKDSGLVGYAFTAPTFDGGSGTTWETVSGVVSGATLAGLGSVYVRPLFRGRTGGSAANVYQVQFMSIEDVTSEVAAGGSATAAATSASSAAASSSSAGTSATAASGSATTAATAASDASTFASQSSSSAGDAASSATSAGTQATNAASSAATASTQASNASASAASASSFAAIAAGVSSGSIGRNAGFDDYPATPGLPTGWSLWSGDAANMARAADGSGGYAVSITGPAATASGIIQQTDTGTSLPGWYVGEVEAELISGTWDAAGAYMNARNSGGTSVADVLYRRFAIDADSSGVVSNSRTGRRRWTQLSQVAAADASYATIYCMAHWDTGGGSLAVENVIRFHMVRLRPATAAEIQQQTVLVPLSASVATLQSTVVDLESQYALARYALSATTPGGAAILSLVSDSYGTVAGLSADQIYLGENTIFDNATDTWRTTTGTTLRVTACGAAFGTDGTLLEWEGSSSVAFASMSRANAYHYTANALPYAGGTRRLVRTDLVENEAITKEWRLDSQSVVSYVSSGAMTTRTTVFSMTLTATGKKITFDGKYLLSARHSQDAWNLYVVVERLAGSSTVDVFTSKRGALAISGDGYISDWQHISFTDTPPVGTVVYTVRVYHDYTIGSPGAFVNYDVSNRILSAREHRTET